MTAEPRLQRPIAGPRLRHLSSLVAVILTISSSEVSQSSLPPQHSSKASPAALDMRGI